MTEQKLEELLADMRMDVVWTDKATMPIPLYKRMKAALQAEADTSHTKYIQCCKDKYEIATRELELQAELKKLSLKNKKLSEVINYWTNKDYLEYELTQKALNEEKHDKMD